MKINYIVILVTAFVPMVLGTLWYGPLFGKAWMKEVGFTKDSMRSANMPLILGLSFLFSCLIAFIMQMMVIHQWGIYSTLAGEPGFNEKTGEGFQLFKNLIITYGDRFRTFKHGVLHGILYGFFLVLPIIGIKSLFERRGFKYIAINSGYWIVTLALMGGIVSQWG